VIQPRVPCNIVEGAAGSPAEIPCPEHDMPDPRLDHGCCAHGAWLKGRINGAVLQDPPAQVTGGLSESYHLRVGRGVLEAFPLVMPPSDNLPVEDHNRTDRDFS
jgi:hypothetical protein